VLRRDSPHTAHRVDFAWRGSAMSALTTNLVACGIELRSRCEARACYGREHGRDPRRADARASQSIAGFVPPKSSSTRFAMSRLTALLAWYPPHGRQVDVGGALPKP
jgi:hypothetical protein